MAKTEVRGGQIKDTSVQRSDLDTTTSGEAVVRRIIAGTNVSLGSTGVDTGTGDVTINIQPETSDFIRASNLLGGTIKFIATGYDNSLPTGNISLVDGTAFYEAIIITTSSVITGVSFIQGVQGSYTADNNNYIGLYSYSSGTLTQVAITTNNGNLWKASANTFVKTPFTSSYSASPGIYFLGCLYNSSAQTTAPSIAGVVSSSAALSSQDFTNSAKFIGTIASQTALPSSQAMSGLTTTGAFRWLALY